MVHPAGAGREEAVEEADTEVVVPVVEAVVDEAELELELELPAAVLYNDNLQFPPHFKLASPLQFVLQSESAFLVVVAANDPQ